MTQKMKDGGPAFARAAAWSPGGTSVSPSQDGMTLRQRYAEKAPPVPDWYEPARLTPKPAVPTMLELNIQGHERVQFDGLRNGSLAENAADLQVLGAYRECLKAEERRAEWELQGLAERFFSWRWYYADQMLASEHLPAVNAEPA